MPLASGTPDKNCARPIGLHVGAIGACALNVRVAATTTLTPARVTLPILLFTSYFLLLTFYFLLSTFYFLLFTFYFSLPHVLLNPLLPHLSTVHISLRVRSNTLRSARSRQRAFVHIR